MLVGWQVEHEIVGEVTPSWRALCYLWTRITGVVRVICSCLLFCPTVARKFDVQKMYYYAMPLRTVDTIGSNSNLLSS